MPRGELRNANRQLEREYSTTRENYAPESPFDTFANDRARACAHARARKRKNDNRRIGTYERAIEGRAGASPRPKLISPMRNNPSDCARSRSSPSPGQRPHVRGH